MEGLVWPKAGNVLQIVESGLSDRFYVSQNSKVESRITPRRKVEQKPEDKQGK